MSEADSLWSPHTKELTRCVAGSRNACTPDGDCLAYASGWCGSLVSSEQSLVSKAAFHTHEYKPTSLDAHVANYSDQLILSPNLQFDTLTDMNTKHFISSVLCATLLTGAIHCSFAFAQDSDEKPAATGEAPTPPDSQKPAGTGDAPAPPDSQKPANGDDGKTDTMKAAEERLKQRELQAAARKAALEAEKANREALAKVVDQLVAEANELNVVDREPEHKAHFKRPHPIVETIRKSDMALAALERMNGSFTGKDVLDLYIRWHMMPIFKTATDEDNKASGRQIIELIKKLSPDPPEGVVPYKQVWHYEPPELKHDRDRLWHSIRVSVGYPPYRRTVHGAGAIKHLKGAEKAAAEKKLQQIAAMDAKITKIQDPEAAEFNNQIRRKNERIWRLRDAYREYRGEIIYALVRTGDPRMLDLIGKEIARLVKSKSPFALDLLGYLYRAGFDGVLDRYSSEDLAKFGENLKTVARSADAWVTFSYRYHHHTYRQHRNFADYSYHLILTLTQHEKFSKELEAAMTDPSLSGSE